MKVILTGSTGMLGQGVLNECLASPDIEAVLCLNRSPLGRQHEKLEEVMVDDFLDLSSIEHRLTEFDAVFYCLGTSSAGVTEKQYRQVTIEMPVHFAKLLTQHNCDAAFTYVSAEGADISSNTMWAKVKGEAEERIRQSGLRHTYLFRPAITINNNEVEIRNRVNRLAMLFMNPLYPVLKRLFPNYVTTTQQFGQAMIQLSLHTETNHSAVIGCKEINALTASR